MKVNGGIRAGTVRLIDEANNQVGIVQRDVALVKARQTGLDLVEVAPQSDPPVCRIMDYGKWLYEQKRKYRAGRKKSTHHSTVLKEIRLRPETDRHDLDVKVAHARQFIEKGHKVQFTMFFKGRQMLHRDLGYEMLNQVTGLLEDISKVEQIGKMTGRRMTLMLVPK